MSANYSAFQRIDKVELLRVCLIIFLTAIAVRFSYVFFFVRPEYLLLEDQGQYIKLALDFSNTGFLGITPERVPGYPSFLSLLYSIFGEKQQYIIIIQAIIDSVSCVFIGLLAQLIFSRGLLISGIISALNLNMVILSATILTDTLFLFIFIIFLLSLVNYLQKETWTWLFLSILLISVATLVRPVSYYLLPVLLVVLVIWRLLKRDNFVKISMVVILCVSIVASILGGVQHRNYTKYNAVALASDTGTHLLGWVVPATYQYSGMGTYQEGQLLAREKFNLAQKRDDLSSLPSNPFDASVYQSNIGKEILLEFGFFRILKAWTVGSIINLLAPSAAYAPIVRNMEHHPSFYKTQGKNGIDKLYNYVNDSNGFLYLLILTIGTLTSILFTFLAIYGLVKMILSSYRKEKNSIPPKIITIFLVLVGYFLAITGPIIGVKYRLPIEPILTMFILSLSWFCVNCRSSTQSK